MKQKRNFPDRSFDQRVTWQDTNVVGARRWMTFYNLYDTILYNPKMNLTLVVANAQSAEIFAWPASRVRFNKLLLLFFDIDIWIN